MSAALCVSPRCRIIDVHRTTCTREDCTGCHPRDTDRPQYCDICRARLAGLLVDLQTWWARLGEHQIEHGQPWRVTQYRPDASGALQPTVEPGSDPVARQLPAHGPARTSSGPRVSGSREAPVPINLDEVDLALPPRPTPVRDPHGDQTGHVPVATLLYIWVDEWSERLTAQLPSSDIAVVRNFRNLQATVPALRGWLSNHLTWAIDTHPHIADFETEIAAEAAAVRAIVDPPPARPERIIGVACRHCDTMSLYRDATYAAECAFCGQLYTEIEYHDWVKEQAANAKRLLT